jgi:uncharacterized membrane protein YeaQ/YmgE (transglycosylase-associated protein family)
MWLKLVAVLIAACVCGVIASAIMSWASNRSALFNMVFGGVLAVGVLAAALIIAFLLTQAAYPN